MYAKIENNRIVETTNIPNVLHFGSKIICNPTNAHMKKAGYIECESDFLPHLEFEVSNGKIKNKKKDNVPINVKTKEGWECPQYQYKIELNKYDCLKGGKYEGFIFNSIVNGHRITRTDTKIILYVNELDSEISNSNDVIISKNVQ